MSQTSTATKSNPDDPSVCLEPGYFIDSDADIVTAFAQDTVGSAQTDVAKAELLYYAVRDLLPYDPYRLSYTPEGFRASTTLEQGYGFCITKAAVLAAAARAVGVPARLGFADVRNHLTSAKLRESMGTDVFAFHGFTELFLGGAWVKSTPAFNLSLCEKIGIKPLDFDPVTDSIFHPFDAQGRRHMEYLRSRGSYIDVPFDELMDCWAEVYGWDAAREAQRQPFGDWRDFENEAEAG